MTLEERLAFMERLAIIEEKLDNHIRHFGWRLDNLDRRFQWLLGVLVGILVAIVVAVTQ